MHINFFLWSRGRCYKWKVHAVKQGEWESSTNPSPPGSAGLGTSWWCIEIAYFTSKKQSRIMQYPNAKISMKTTTSTFTISSGQSYAQNTLTCQSGLIQWQGLCYSMEVQSPGGQGRLWLGGSCLYGMLTQSDALRHLPLPHGNRK